MSIKSKLKHLKKFKPLGIQAMVFVGIYAITMTIIAISRVPQTALSFEEVKSQFQSFTPFVQVVGGVVSLGFQGFYYLIKKRIV